MIILSYEIKKILSSRTARISLVILSLLTVIHCAKYVYSVSWTNDDGSHFSGPRAIALIREAKNEWKGPITEDVIHRVIIANKQITENPAYQKQGGLSNEGFSKIQGFYDIRDMINRFCAVSLSDYDYYTADRLSPDASDEFYQKRITQFSEWLGRDDVRQMFTPPERSYISDSVQNLKTPFNYAYHDGFSAMQEMNAFLTFAVVIVICIIVAAGFSIECQTKADTIYFSTPYGNTRGNRAKITAGFLLATAVYWGIMLTADFIILIFFHMDGADTPVQIDYFKCILNITQLQAWALFLLAGYAGSLLMAGITMLVSAVVRTSYAAMILAFLMIMAPATYGEFTTSRTVQNILSFFPHTSLMGSSFLRTYSFFHIGSFIIPQAYVLPLLHSAAALILIPLIYKGFEKYK